MKTKFTLIVVGLYALVAASVIPSPIMKYAFNLFSFASAVLFMIAVCMAFGSKEVIRSAVKKAKDKGKLEEVRQNFEKGLKQLHIVYIPVILAMIAVGHWVIGLFWIITWIIMLGLHTTIFKELKRENKIERR